MLRYKSTGRCQCPLQWWSTTVTAVLQRVAAVSTLRTSQVSCLVISPTTGELNFSPVALVWGLYMRKEQMNWQTYKERLSSTEPAGFRLRNSHLRSTCPHSWLDERSPSVTWASLRWTHCDGGWGLWLRGNIAHGSLRLFKKLSLCTSRTQPKPGSQFFWTPWQWLAHCHAMEWNGVCLFCDVYGISSQRPKTGCRLLKQHVVRLHGMEWDPVLKSSEEACDRKNSGVSWKDISAPDVQLLRL